MREEGLHRLERGLDADVGQPVSFRVGHLSQRGRPIGSRRRRARAERLPVAHHYIDAAERGDRGLRHRGDLRRLADISGALVRITPDDPDAQHRLVDRSLGA